MRKLTERKMIAGRNVERSDRANRTGAKIAHKANLRAKGFMIKFI